MQPLLRAINLQGMNKFRDKGHKRLAAAETNEFCEKSAGVDVIELTDGTTIARVVSKTLF